MDLPYAKKENKNQNNIKSINNERSESDISRTITSKRIRAAQTKGPRNYYVYDVDISSDKVRKKVLKYCFKIKPWEFLRACSDGKLPIEVQATFQAAKPYIDSLRNARMNVTRSMTNCNKDWRAKLFKYFTFVDSTNSIKDKTLRVIYQRYCRFCKTECSRTLRLLKILGISEDLFHFSSVKKNKACKLEICKYGGQNISIRSTKYKPTAV